MTKHLKRGPFIEGDKVQLTGPKGRMNTITLVAGAAFGTHRGDLRHDDIIGKPGAVSDTRAKLVPSVER